MVKTAIMLHRGATPAKEKTAMENLKTIVSGKPAAAMFSAAEMNRRLDSLRATMAEEGADNITGFPFGPEHNIVGG